MKLYHFVSIAGLIAFISSGCQRAGAPDSSRIAIQFPNKAQFLNSLKTSSQVSAQGLIDYSLLCFAVNVKSPLISSSTQACDVERGISVGSVPPGSEIIIADVPMGSGNSFEIYGLLRGTSSEACPKVDKTTWNHPLQKIYLIGKTESVTLAKPDEVVTIYLKMPDQSAHLAAKNAFPSSCTSAGTTAAGSFLLGAGVLTSANFKLKSRVSFKEESTELLGSTLKIKRWKTGVSP